MTEVQKVDIGSKQIYGFKTRTNNASEMNPDTQQIAGPWKRFIVQTSTPFPHYGVYYHYDSDLHGAYDILAGTDTALQEKCDTVTIQEGRYLKFTAKGELHEAVMHCWKHIWAYFEDPSVDERRAYETDFECYVSNDKVEVYIGVHYF